MIEIRHTRSYCCDSCSSPGDWRERDMWELCGLVDDDDDRGNPLVD